MQTLNIESSSTVPFMPNYDEPLDTRPIQKKWTSDEYYRLADLGFFQGKRVQLIEGEIIEMAPMGSPHITCIMIIGRLLQNAFGEDFSVRTQGTLDLGIDSQPEPDVAVVAGDLRDYVGSHPTSAVLLIEVLDSTLLLDRKLKGSIYAQNSIEDYWIVNLKNRTVEVYRKPVADSTMGFVYSEQTVVSERESISPLGLPNTKISVMDILP